MSTGLLITCQIRTCPQTSDWLGNISCESIGDGVWITGGRGARRPDAGALRRGLWVLYHIVEPRTNRCLSTPRRSFQSVNLDDFGLTG